MPQAADDLPASGNAVFVSLMVLIVAQAWRNLKLLQVPVLYHECFVSKD
ncbi:hypothetical protein [Salinimonas lutimaris]|nr:hypothetical protein [Salinimonas lutimaris]